LNDADDGTFDNADSPQTGIGANVGGGTSQFLAANVVEIVHFENQLSSDDNDNMIGYLGWIANDIYSDNTIVNAFDSGFAYKSAAPLP